MAAAEERFPVTVAAEESSSAGPADQGGRAKAWGVWLCFVWLLIACGTAPQPSPDVWWQLAGGRLMMEEGRFPLTDPFSFTAGDAQWLNHEWLAECGMYWVYMHCGGLVGLEAAKLFILFLVFWLMGRVAVGLSSREPCAALAAGLAVMAAQWRFFFDIRPYLFSYLGLALTAWCVSSWFRSGRPGWLVLLLPVYALWANLHSGVIAGFALALGWALGSAPRQPRAALMVVAATVGCALASLANPYGTHILTFPFQFTRGGVWSAGLNEWARPALFGEQWPFSVYLAFSWACALTGRARLGAGPLLVLAGFSVLACTAWRHLTVYAIVSVPMVAVGIQTLLERRLGPVSRLPWGPAALAVGSVGICVQLWLTDFSSLGLERQMFPVEAVTFLRANRLPTRMLNAYGWGGYFDWALWPRGEVFMDGRANTLFPDTVYRDYLLAMQGSPQWAEILHRYDVHMVVLNTFEGAQRSLSQTLPNSPDWVRVYDDGVAQIYLQRDATTESMMADFAAGRWTYPPSARLSMARDEVNGGHFDAAEKIVRALLQAHQEEAAAHGVYAVIEIRRGRPQEAEAHLRQAIALDPTMRDLHFNLAMVLHARHDDAGEKAALEAELQLNPACEPARRRLQQLKGAP